MKKYTIDTKALHEKLSECKMNDFQNVRDVIAAEKRKHFSAAQETEDYATEFLDRVLNVYLVENNILGKCFCLEHRGRRVVNKVVGINKEATNRNELGKGIVVDVVIMYGNMDDERSMEHICKGTISLLDLLCDYKETTDDVFYDWMKNTVEQFTNGDLQVLRPQNIMADDQVGTTK